jgi:diaminopimelate epimerase
MGHPKVNAENSDFNEVKNFVESQAKKLGMPELTRDWHLVSISNRHLCFFLDSVNRDMIRKVGPALQASSLWDGINVHLCASKRVMDEDRRISAQVLSGPIDEIYEVFVWERGAGETQACGSGASAIGASAFASGLTDRRNWLGIDMPGGRLYVKQENAADSVTLAGPAQMVFRGRLEI